MPTTDQLQFEMQRRVILFNSGTTMPDNSVLGYEGNPNYASTATDGQTLLYNSPRGTHYIELVNGNLWYKQQIPNTWINLTSGTQSGTAGTSSQNNVVFVTGNQTISGIKTFASRPTVNGTGVLLSGDIPYVQTNSYFYVDATRADSYIENGNILYPYKTLSGAYNAAKNIAYFHNPTYITLLSPIAENLTIDKGYINLVGNNTNKNDPIRITGSLVFAATGIGSTITDNNFSIAGLGVTATSNNKCILFSGNNPQRLFVQDCWLIAKDNGTCLYSNNTNTTSRLQGDILKLSPEGVNTTAIDIVSGTSSISFAETSSSASVLAYVRNNSTLNISNSQIETAGVKAFQVENGARLTLLNSVLTNTAYPSTGIFLTNAGSTAVVVGSAISVPANANSYAINGVAYSYLFYKNLYFSIDATGGSTESKIGNNVNKNLINSYDPVVYSTGNQTISGVKTFDLQPILSGNPLITGVDLSSYATTTNLASTGSTLTSNINSLSGTLTGNYLTTSSASSTYATITNLGSTGSTLQTNINNLSNTYATITNLASTGSTLVTNLASTGSTLDTKINNLSGVSVLTFGNQTITGIKTFNSGLGTKYISGVSGSNLDIIGYSGEADTSNRSINIQAGHGPTTIPLAGGGINITAGNSPNFSANTSNINLRAGTGTNNSAGGINIYAGASPNYAGTNSIFGNININSDGFSTPYSKTINIYRSGNIGVFPYPFVGVVIDNNKVDVNNGMALQVSGVNVTPSLYATSANLASTGSTLVTNLASTGSTLQTNINNLSNTYATITNLASTGSTLNTRINNLSGYINSTSSNIVFTTGNQTISGIKSFAQDTTFGDSSQGDFLVISGNQFTVYGSGNFTSGLFVNGNAVLTGVNLNSYATTANLASTGSTLDTKINNLSGYVTGITGTFGASVNSLNANAVFITGNQIISGNKSFKNTLSVTNISGLSGVGGPTSIDIKGMDNAYNAFGSSYLGGNIYATAGSGNLAGGSIYLYAGKYGPTAYGGNINAIASNIYINDDNTSAKTINIYKTGVGATNTNVSIGQTSVNISNTFTISGVEVTPALYVNTTTNQTIAGVKTFTNTGVFTSGINLNNSKLINATPDLLNVSANFNITGTQNSRVILANSSTIITGSIVSGNPTGFNTSIIQTSSGQVLITGIGSNVIVSSYNNQFRTAAQYATISILHTGNDGYIMYGNTST
jgi:hypothetical protein